MAETRTIRIAATLDSTGERSDVEREAEVHGEHFGVFKLADRLWNITHVPTGVVWSDGCLREVTSKIEALNAEQRAAITRRGVA